MKAVVSSVILAALLGLVNAKVQITNSNFDDVEAGSTFEITWDDAEGPVTLTLKDGDSDNLQDVETITSGASGNSYVWSVDSDLPSGDYAIEIDDGTDVNYSQMFAVEGSDDTTTSSATSSASSTVSITSSTASPSSTTSETTSEESTSTESSSTESTAESTTTSESSTATSSAESTTTHASSSAVTRTTSSAPTSTESDAAETSVPNSNDVHHIAAPLVPGIIAILGAALI
ncbi:hypothetical protein EKO27_g6258 [Xylaria grammica]|uniref:Yeast cell wall synthesis Kre9/Knh1-like N-terminal domain-containing protein n=1 Tax=Xylaria grammica TaxID=363999 RepID=A0A439D323_9PEZI|nr:hypothetical protein EKO27_g6258 [Xylaria grammica]